MNGHPTAIRLPDTTFSTHTIPLLDDEFDTGEEETLDHGDVFTLHTGPHLQDELDGDFDDIKIEDF